MVLYDARSAEVFRGGPEDLPDAEAKLKQAVMQGSSLQDAGPGQVVAAITLGGHPIGGLAMTGCQLSDGALQALLNLVAIALERVRTEEAANRAEAARQSEEFKSTLMDAIAHEFKTPLTSIKAAATALQSDYEDAPPAVRELASIIDEETDRLSLLVTEGGEDVADRCGEGPAAAAAGCAGGDRWKRWWGSLRRGWRAGMWW